MSAQLPLLEIWEASSALPFYPTVRKDTQFTVGFALLLAAFILTGVFGLTRSIVTLPALGVPASLAFGFGAVYMICAAGVYV